MTPDQPLRLQSSPAHAPAADNSSPPPPVQPPAQGGGNIAQPAGPRSGFVYDGKLSELYGIFLLNLLWTFLTLSIFRFWAKTRMRRYLWSRTSLNGDRFEYTGTGGELFIGFLIVIAAYVIISIGIQILGIFTEPGSPALSILQSLLLLVILYLTFVAQYAAQRYRLTRTLWRGIRGGMTGSAWAWGIKGFFFSILSLLSLTLAWPWAQMRLIDDRINNSYFGDAKASIKTTSAPLYLPYILGLVATLVGTAIIGWVAYSVAEVRIAGMSGEVYETPTDLQEETIFTFVIAILAVYFGMFVISIVTFAFYVAAMAREIAAKLSMGSLRFATPLTAGRVIGRYLGNFAIIIFTLGLGLPIAIHRTMLFLAANIEVIGEIEGSDITHANLPRPKAGEGLLEAFDPGIL